jgi:hypothetical protein
MAVKLLQCIKAAVICKKFLVLSPQAIDFLSCFIYNWSTYSLGDAGRGRSRLGKFFLRQFSGVDAGFASPFAAKS